MAAGGLKPVAALYSTFLQRAADSLIHDVCLQNLPVVFALDRSGLVSGDGETHQGIFDISLFRSAPNLSILAPAGKEEVAQMLDWALSDGERGPVILRYPKALCPSGDPAFSQPLEKGRGVWIQPAGSGRPSGSDESLEAGFDVCIAFTGSLYPQALEAAEHLEREGIRVGLYNLRFLKPIDEDYLEDLMNRCRLAVFVEEGMRAGGFGEYAAELAMRRNCSCKVLVLGARECFDALGKREELLQENSLDGEGIALSVRTAFSLEPVR
jgi:1-deoxy-D-xylulose-5-phosphate synthase